MKRKGRKKKNVRESTRYKRNDEMTPLNTKTNDGTCERESNGKKERECRRGIWRERRGSRERK